jgi:hypothetical protein
MPIAQKEAQCCELTVTAGCGLPERFPTRHFMCIAQESCCHSRRTEIRACGLANRRTGFGCGNDGESDIGLVGLFSLFSFLVERN